jgi:hypothetical protein
MNSDVFTFKTAISSLSYVKKHDINMQLHQQPIHTILWEMTAYVRRKLQCTAHDVTSDTTLRRIWNCKPPYQILQFLLPHQVQEIHSYSSW